MSDSIAAIAKAARIFEFNLACDRITVRRQNSIDHTMSTMVVSGSQAKELRDWLFAKGSSPVKDITIRIELLEPTELPTDIS